MAISNINKNEMINIVMDRLSNSNLSLNNPEVVARNLLSYYNYDIDKVLELAV